MRSAHPRVIRNVEYIYGINMLIKKNWLSKIDIKKLGGT